MKILIVTDGTNQAETALSFAAQIVQRIDEPPTILAVTTDPTNSLSSRSNDILGRGVDLVGISGMQTKVRRGEPCEGILHEVDQGDFDLVILGDRKPQRFINRMLKGSVARRVAEYASCSVIVVRGKATRIHRILLCDSGAGTSSLLSRFVVQLSELLEGEEDVTVLHVMSQISAGPGVRGSQLRADAQELIEDLTPEGKMLARDIEMLDTLGIHPQPKIRHGLVVDEILAEARGGDYDLVVVGAHSPSGQQGFLLDNIAHQILQRVNRPILVVRSKQILEPSQ